MKLMYETENNIFSYETGSDTIIRFNKRTRRYQNEKIRGPRGHYLLGLIFRRSKINRGKMIEHQSDLTYWHGIVGNDFIVRIQNGAKVNRSALYIKGSDRNSYLTSLLLRKGRTIATQKQAYV
jgi:hypothetical protein